MDDERGSHDLALAIDLERRAAAELLEEVDDVRGEEAARRARHAAREIGEPDDRDALHDDDLSGHARRAVAALLGGEIDDDRAGLQRRDHLFGEEDGRALSRDERGRDDDVDLGGLRAEEGDLRGEEGRAHLLRVAAAAFGVLDDVDVEVRRAEALDCSFGRGPRVEGADLGAERTRSGHRREPGDPRADDEHARGRDGARRGDLRAERALEALRRLDDRAIAREVRHRRQDVHLLGARDARDALERDRRSAARGDERGELLVALGLEEREERSRTSHLVVRRRPDLRDDVAGAPHVGRRARRRRPRRASIRAEPAPRHADSNQREQLLHRLGRRRDALLVRGALFRNPDTNRT